MVSRASDTPVDAPGIIVGDTTSFLVPLFAGRERVYGTGMLRAEHPDVAVTFGIHPS